MDNRIKQILHLLFLFELLQHLLHKSATLAWQLDLVPSSNHHVPSPEKRDLFPFQKEGVRKLVNEKKILLADEMGLGKTVQCIAAINEIYDQRLNRCLKNQQDECSDSLLSVLIVCPKSVMGVWKKELRDWLTAPLEIHTVTAPDFLIPSSNSQSVVLINYDICYRFRNDFLRSFKFDILICDEAHYLKNTESKRTIAVLGDSGSGPFRRISSEYLWFLTGTPVLNQPKELYPVLHALSPEDFPSYRGFRQKYCLEYNPDKVFGGDARKLVNLSRRLKPLMVRRYKMDVLTQLPPKFHSCVYLNDPSVAAEECDEIETILAKNFKNDEGTGSDDIADDNKALKELGSDAFNLKDYILTLPFLRKKKKLVALDSSSKISFNNILNLLALVRKRTAARKIDPAIELLEDVIMSHKVVVFAYHRHVIQELQNHFGDKAVSVLGGMKAEDRITAVTQFQEDPNVQIFIGSIRAAGLGLTLTAASHVVFIEMDLSPGVMAQAEDRCHRVGQTENVLIQYYVYENTIDAWIAELLIKKQNLIQKILPKDADTNHLQQQQQQREPGFVLNFGRFSGVSLEDLPKDYRDFLIENEVWESRLDLWTSMFQKGFISKEPPSAEDFHQGILMQQKNTKKSDTYGNFTKAHDLKAANETAVLERYEQKIEYVFDFGKHKEKCWNDVPLSYREWIIKEKVWKQRINLWKALIKAGLLNDFPPSDIKPGQLQESDSLIGNNNEQVHADYVFEFGKHRGKHWNDTPLSYRKWIINEKVWRNKMKMFDALSEAGLIN